MVPVADGTDTRSVRLRLAFRHALQNLPVVTCNGPIQSVSTLLDAFLCHLLQFNYLNRGANDSRWIVDRIDYRR